jgi:hypothetical protein
VAARTTAWDRGSQPEIPASALGDLEASPRAYGQHAEHGDRRHEGEHVHQCEDAPDAALVGRVDDTRVLRLVRDTSEGEAALHGWLTDSTTLTFEQRNEGLLKFFFADALSSEEAVELVRAMRHHHELILAGIHQATPPYRPERRFGYLTKEYGLGLHGWIVEWCKETERELASGLAPRELETT